MLRSAVGPQPFFPTERPRVPASELPHQPATRSRFSWHGLVEEDDAKETLPGAIETTCRPRNVWVAVNKLEAKYNGKGNHSHDCGSVRTDWPCPQRSFAFYFEVTVVDAGAHGSIAVGVADAKFPLERMPGWEARSYGYHDDGRRYSESERGEPFGPRFGAGDVIGCGLLSERRELFFTKNGESLGVAYGSIEGAVYPTIGMHSLGVSVKLNLGAAPFAFDIESMVRTRREARCDAVLDGPGPPPDPSYIHGLVRSYLLHHNYEATLAELDAGSEPPPPVVPPTTAAVAPSSPPASAPASAPAAAAAASSSSSPSTSEATSSSSALPGANGGPAALLSRAGSDAAASGLSRTPASLEGGKGSDGRGSPEAEAEAGAAEPAMDVEAEASLPPLPEQLAQLPAEQIMRATIPHRRQLRTLLTSGKVADAYALTERLFPRLLGRNADVQFLLRCQHFIELLRSRKPLDAIAYGRAELAQYRPAPPARPAPGSSSAWPGPTDTWGWPDPSAWPTPPYNEKTRRNDPALFHAGLPDVGLLGGPPPWPDPPPQPNKSTWAAATAAATAATAAAAPDPAAASVRRLLLREVFGLIAFEPPPPEALAGAGPPVTVGTAQPSLHLYGDAHREVVAETLNGAVLQELGLSPCSAIEWMLRQLIEVTEAARDANGGYGENVRFAEEADEWSTQRKKRRRAADCLGRSSRPTKLKASDLLAQIQGGAEARERDARMR